MKQLNTNSGFSLIELLIGMALFTGLIAVVIAFQSLLSQSEEFGFKTALSIESANASVQTIINELRLAKESENGAYPLEIAQDQEIVFYSNADKDEDIERLRYFLDGSELKKGTINPTGFPATYPSQDETVRIIAQNVTSGTNPIFYYYNQDWPTDQTNNPLATPAPLSQITLVKVSVTVNANPNQPESEISFEPFVQIRSLKSNL